MIQVQHPTPAVTDHSTNSEMPKTTLVTPIPTISNATKSNIQKENNEVATKLTTAPSNRHQSQLPQTGTNDNDVIVGLALAGLASVLGLTGIQKRKDN
ncbi:adhesion exoprotein [Limosilactobacillus coleohominis DSM 14060]|nr:adhesion exoprotein [Limosilactobacillus coleohominis DSM 14060]